jgi:hypothetical protein
MCRLSRSMGAWKPEGLSRPVMGLLIFFNTSINFRNLRKLFLKSQGCYWSIFRAWGCLFPCHKNIALYRFSDNIVVHHVSNRFSESNSKNAKTPNKYVIVIKGDDTASHWFRCLFSRALGKRHKLITLIDWLTDYWFMGNSTANTGYGAENFRQAVSNHGSFHHVVFSQWDRRQATPSVCLLFFSGFPGSYSYITLNYSIKFPFQILSNLFLFNRETALMDCVKFGLLKLHAVMCGEVVIRCARFTL